MAIVPSMEAGPAPVAGPERRGGHPLWSASTGAAEVRFVGRGPGGERDEILARVEGRGVPVAQAKQVHSDRVLAAHEGFVGEGDALWTDRPGLALSVITADCVPLLLASRDGRRVAAVHAGWRGIVAGVVERAIEVLAVPAEDLDAWIGPAIGACCYEVGDEVAERVAAFTGTEVVVPGPRLGPGRRPHLDLPGAVRQQLARAGVAAPRVVVRCTRCDAERLWSYRREGPGGGRNVAYVWASER